MATPKKKKVPAARKGKKISAKGQMKGGKEQHERNAMSHITADMRIADVVTLLPDAERLLAEYGLHCANCTFGAVDTVGAGARSHGFSDADVTQLLADLNELLDAAPSRPQTIIVTLSAAQALQAILQAEGQEDAVLSVEADARGNFCMEFHDAPGPDDRIFAHPEAPSVRVVASTAALLRIGGATIDFREGRFKLDLPSHVQPPCACDGKTCGCATKKGAAISGSEV